MASRDSAYLLLGSSDLPEPSGLVWERTWASETFNLVFNPLPLTIPRTSLPSQPRSLQRAPEKVSLHSEIDSQTNFVSYQESNMTFVPSFLPNGPHHPHRKPCSLLFVPAHISCITPQHVLFHTYFFYSHINVSLTVFIVLHPISMTRNFPLSTYPVVLHQSLPQMRVQHHQRAKNATSPYVQPLVKASLNLWLGNGPPKILRSMSTETINKHRRFRKRVSIFPKASGIGQP